MMEGFIDPAVSEGGWQGGGGFLSVYAAFCKKTEVIKLYLTNQCPAACTTEVHRECHSEPSAPGSSKPHGYCLSKQTKLAFRVGTSGVYAHMHIHKHCNNNLSGSKSSCLSYGAIKSKSSRNDWPLTNNKSIVTMAMESRGKQQGLLMQAGNEMIIPCRWSGCQGVTDLEWLCHFSSR